MKILKAKRTNEAEIPETWAEAEELITKAMSYHEGRGYNLAIHAVCARIAYGLLCDQSMTPDPTTALAFLMQRICQSKGAGLNESRTDPENKKACG
jgi:hypothetical protein